MITSTATDSFDLVELLQNLKKLWGSLPANARSSPAKSRTRTKRRRIPTSIPAATKVQCINDKQNDRAHSSEEQEKVPKSKEAIDDVLKETTDAIEYATDLLVDLDDFRKMVVSVTSDSENKCGSRRGSGSGSSTGNLGDVREELADLWDDITDDITQQWANMVCALIFKVEHAMGLGDGSDESIVRRLSIDVSDVCDDGADEAAKAAKRRCSEQQRAKLPIDDEITHTKDRLEKQIKTLEMIELIMDEALDFT